jgi:hypothetical protein
MSGRRERETTVPIAPPIAAAAATAPTDAVHPGLLVMSHTMPSADPFTAETVIHVPGARISRARSEGSG